MPGRFWLASMALVGCLAAAPVARAQPGSVSDEEVGKAIERLVKWFYDKQGADGTWEALYTYSAAHQKPNEGGLTAMSTVALIYAGESAANDRLSKAIAWLKSPKLTDPAMTDFGGTYALGLRAHVWSHLNDSYRPLLQRDAEALLVIANLDSTFHYNRRGGKPHDSSTRTGPYDHSNTQYGHLGLWEATKRGVAVAPGFWRDALKHWISTQDADGGWGYRNKDSTYPSMTCAGLTGMFVARQSLFRDQDRPDKETQDCIARGLRYLDKEFVAGQGRGHSSGMPWYYMMDIERVALASGVKDLGGKDWYREGVTLALAELNRGRIAGANSQGRTAPETAFALMFLARGRVPVWISKLQIDKSTDNRPDDIYSLSQYLSEYREGEVTFYRLSIDEPVEEWRSTPLLYLASDQAVNLSPEQQAKLRKYLDLGGLLFCNPDNASSAFMESIRRLAKALYPESQGMAALPADHPLYTVQHHLGNAIPVQGLHNGARDLILMPTKDCGLVWQSEVARKAAGGMDALRLGANLFVMATDRGVIQNRLVDRVEKRQGAGGAGTLVMGRARYEGNWCPEPAAWEALATRVHNRGGPTLTVQDIDLAQIGTSDLKLIHLGGCAPLRLSAEQRAAIKAYAERGGMLLVEDIGGRSGFAIGIQDQIKADMGGASALWLTDQDDPIITGKGLAGGDDASSVAYRRWTAWFVTQIGTLPKLAAYYKNNRPAVILAYHDLSLGLLDVRHWGVSGYAPESARRIFANIVLAAHSAGSTPASPSTAPSPGAGGGRKP